MDKPTSPEAINQFEFQRARQWLETYCQDRGVAAVTEDFMITENRHLRCLTISTMDSITENVRFCLGVDGWHLFWQRAPGFWAYFPRFSGIGRWSEIAEALESAPLHVHWSPP